MNVDEKTSSRSPRRPRAATGRARCRPWPRPEPPPRAWVVVDQYSRLLAVDAADGDQALYRGTAPRSLGPAARDLILRPMEAAETHRPGRVHTDTVTWGGMRWRTRVIPLIGAVSGQLNGRMACYIPDDGHATFPEPPVIGAVEWELPRAGEGPPMSWWDEGQWRVFGLLRPDGHPGGWPLATIVDELLDPAERPVVQQAIDDVAASNTDRLVTYQCWAMGHQHLLRVAVRPDITRPGWARGTVMRLRGCHDHSTTETLRAARLVEACCALSEDPLAAVDGLHEQIYMTSAQWTRAGLWLPLDRSLPALVHPDDHAVLRQLITDAAHQPHHHPVGPVTVRLATADADCPEIPDGGWSPRAVWGVGWLTEAHHALLKVCRPSAA